MLSRHLYIFEAVRRTDSLTLLRRLTPSQLAALVLALAAAILALDPIAWLINTWRDPAYDSNGLLVVAMVAALLLWSTASPVARSASLKSTRAIGLLAISAVVRLVGQLSAINVLGALTLVIDVYAIGLLLHLNERKRSISPAWLAITFAFALPLERILQRCLGYALQQISADGACVILRSAFDAVVCEGVRIVLAGRDVLIDLPCSGARTLLLSALAFSIACTVLRPRVPMALTGLALLLASAVAANILRITLLAIGIASPSAIGGIDVMAKPWHDTIGYLSLLLGLLPLTAWMAMAGPPARAADHLGCAPACSTASSTAGPQSHRRLLFAFAALALALVIVNLPRNPVDVARRDFALQAPAWIMGERAEPIPIDPREAAYFTRYGGAAVKASYGAHRLLLVRTSSPLRHLHAPDECLRGIGFDVSYGGLVFEPIPTAHYLAVAPTGERYRIDVTFLSDRGHLTGSVATAVWHWLRGEAAQWTAIQRISPADLPVSEHADFSSSALRVLGVDPPSRLAFQPPKKG
ncbi:MAG: exosortase T [Hyphomicrobium sp.]|nr:exosortase T [Hyphomicrobium sp.]